jgi:hypothetical protein
LNDKSEQSAAASRIIGGITIAEYDGSPRRYRPRGSNETASNASSNSDVSKASGGGGGGSGSVAKVSAAGRAARPGLRMPGFPQRVLPASEAATASTSSLDASPVSLKKEVRAEAANPVEEEELLKFDDIPAAAAQSVTSSVTSPATHDAKKSDAAEPSRKNVSEDFDLRYEFSETRKVLEEFFQTSSVAKGDDDHADKDFNELEYTLRRRSPIAHEQGTELFQLYIIFVHTSKIVHRAVSGLKNSLNKLG